MCRQTTARALLPGTQMDTPCGVAGGGDERGILADPHCLPFPTSGDKVCLQRVDGTCIARQPLVGGQQDDALDTRLGNQDAIERVTVK